MTVSVIRARRDERFNHRRPRPQLDSELTLLPKTSKIPGLWLIRSRNPTRRVVHNSESNEIDSLEPKEPTWKVYLRELTPGKSLGYSRKMKRELAFRAKYVNESRCMLRVLLSWREYTEQFTFVRAMLVRVHRLKFVHKCFVAWWLANQRDARLRVVLKLIELKLVYRRFRLWSVMSKLFGRTHRIARLCFSSWSFYIQYKRRVYKDFACLVARVMQIPHAVVIQRWWKTQKSRRRFRAMLLIAKGLFWGTKLWRRVFRKRTEVERRRLERESKLLAMVLSRTQNTLREYLMSPDGFDDFVDFRNKTERHYRQYSLEYAFDEERAVWVDVKKPHEVKLDAMSRLPSVFKSTIKDVVRNASDMLGAFSSSKPHADKVKAYRIIEDRCVSDIRRAAMEFYRRKHPPPKSCSRCDRTFVLQMQLKSHEKRSRQKDCNPPENKSSGYAWSVAGEFVRRVKEKVLRTFMVDMHPPPAVEKI